MAIVVREVLDATARGCRARLEHCGRAITAELAWRPERAKEHLGEALLVEFAHDAIVCWRRLRGDDPAWHGLFAAGSGEVRVVGRVHSRIDLQNGTLLYDVYLASGPEFATFDSDELSDRALAVGVPLEVTVRGLCVYPTSV
jgi:hypothetical protein